MCHISLLTSGNCGSEHRLDRRGDLAIEKIHLLHLGTFPGQSFPHTCPGSVHWSHLENGNAALSAQEPPAPPGQLLWTRWFRCIAGNSAQSPLPGFDPAVIIPGAPSQTIRPPSKRRTRSQWRKLSMR
jgi:hypothetical protein